MKKHCTRQTRDPMEWINKRLPISIEQQRDLGIAYRMSLQAMLRGHGTEQAWSTLAVSFNVSLLLAEEGIKSQAIETIIQAQNALIAARDRAGRTGKWAFDGAGMRMVLAAANIHDEQLERATRGQIVTAIKEVHRRVMIGEAA